MPWNSSSILVAHRTLARTFILPRAVSEAAHLGHIRKTEKLGKHDELTIREFEKTWKGLTNLNNQCTASLLEVMLEHNCTPEQIL